MEDPPRVDHYGDAAQPVHDLRAALIDCWIAVTNAGGAAGFPYPPVGRAEVAPAVDRIIDELHPRRCRLVTVVDRRGLLGWAVLRRSVDPLITHWGSVHHVQSHPGARGEGVGSLLMREVHKIARDVLGLEQLHLAARGGVGLETFYDRLGWRVVGRWPGALRLGPGDDRDEILMHLDLA